VIHNTGGVLAVETVCHTQQSWHGGRGDCVHNKGLAIAQLPGGGAPVGVLERAWQCVQSEWHG
jgi:hypothetical protein